MPENEKEKKRKTKYEAQKKPLREKAKENKKDELKEKAAEKVGAYFMLPPFLSRFIYHHKGLSLLILVGVPFFGLILFVALIAAVLN